MKALAVVALAVLVASPHGCGATAAAAHSHAAFAPVACFRSALLRATNERSPTSWRVARRVARHHGRAPSAIRSAFGGWLSRAAGLAANSGEAGAGEQRREILEGLSRAELQAVAKENGVPANKKSSEIIELLLDLSPRLNDAVVDRDEVGFDGGDKVRRGGQVTAPELATALGGLGIIVIYPAHGGEGEIELPIACAQFGGGANSVTGTLSASALVFTPPHSADPALGEGGGGKPGRIVVMQRGGGLSFVAKALLAQGADHAASALIIANTDDTLFAPADPSGDGGAVRIPVFLIAAKDAAALQVRQMCGCARERVRVCVRARAPCCARACVRVDEHVIL
jgi:hypothetical protein